MYEWFLRCTQCGHRENTGTPEMTSTSRTPTAPSTTLSTLSIASTTKLTVDESNTFSLPYHLWNLHRQSLNSTIKDIFYCVFFIFASFSESSTYMKIINKNSAKIACTIKETFYKWMGMLQLRIQYFTYDSLQLFILILTLCNYF